MCILINNLAKIIYFSRKDGKTESPKVFLIMFLQTGSFTIDHE
jgi:hypothetical protein